jgi:hypothetical protein
LEGRRGGGKQKIAHLHNGSNDSYLFSKKRCMRREKERERSDRQQRRKQHTKRDKMVREKDTLPNLVELFPPPLPPF